MRVGCHDDRKAKESRAVLEPDLEAAQRKSQRAEKETIQSRTHIAILNNIFPTCLLHCDSALLHC
jgi:hypothetical protein